MTSTDPLNLDAIEVKIADLRQMIDRKNPWPSDNESFSMTEGWKSGTGNALDKLHVETLVAEVRRLRTELAAARRPDTPRLCECGHGHRAHTVPAPHSCFAFGQTCPCPAYRQLPHDQAVAQLEANRQAAAEREAARIAEEMRAVGEEADTDPICGDENDGDWCELEPGHDGHHRADTAEWGADPAVEGAQR